MRHHGRVSTFALEQRLSARRLMIRPKGKKNQPTFSQPTIARPTRVSLNSDGQAAGPWAGFWRPTARSLFPPSDWI